MNDPFVVGQAEAWAKRLLENAGDSPEERVGKIYEAAFARPPATDEVATALAFLKQQQETYDALGGNPSRTEKLWADFCHVIFNVKEFVFVN
jgi:hypothetical protein